MEPIRFSLLRYPSGYGTSPQHSLFCAAIMPGRIRLHFNDRPEFLPAYFILPKADPRNENVFANMYKFVIKKYLKDRFRGGGHTADSLLSITNSRRLY